MVHLRLAEDECPAILRSHPSIQIGPTQPPFDQVANWLRKTDAHSGGWVQLRRSYQHGGTHWALDAAVYWLNKWVVTGTPPPRAPVLATTQVSPVVYKLDANGNVIGGVRAPKVDAPIAALGSQGNSGGFCVLFGSTVPYSAAHVASLYKTHGQFVVAWARPVKRDRADGFLLPADATELLHSAAVSEVARHDR